jgi:hypothetical protein
MVVATVQKQRRIDRLQRQLDIAEAVNFAYVGSRAKVFGGNTRAYASWIRTLERKIAELQGQNLPTAWDALGRSVKLGR